MTAVPHRVTPPRQQIHKAFCRTPEKCQYTGLPPDRVSGWCGVLDQLLDLNDEMLLHAKARELRSEGGELIFRFGAGMWKAAERIDPYTEVPAYDPASGDPTPSADDFPDCPPCAQGKEHYHRKSDGSLVHTPR